MEDLAEAVQISPIRADHAGQGQDAGISSSVRHGGEQEGDLRLPGCWQRDFVGGSSEAAPGSAFKVALLWLPSKVVEGRPFPPFGSL